MKTEENDQQQQIQVVKPLQNRVQRNKAEASKGSKSSHYTRRRQQPDSSEQCLLPAQIPKSTGTQSILTEGFENELTKAVIRIPYNILLTLNFLSLNCVHVQNIQIIINVQRQQQYVTLFAISVKEQTAMQVEDEIKMEQRQYPNDDQKIEQNDVPQQEDFIVPINIWGKFVYLSGFEVQNKGIKKIRKDLSSYLENQIAKFKIKQVNSDLFIYLNLRLEEQYSNEHHGLVNQGNTCYMNSYLQTLYHIPAVRNLVYQAEIIEETKFPATLQDLFFNLGRSQKPVSPDMLVKSFGWGKREASIQQDAQEFSCLFFQALERKLSESAPKKGYKNRTIEGLFKGQLIHYLRCTQVGTVIDNADFRRENYEEFLDLQLPIYPTLAQSLDAYTTEVHMGGDNKYFTEEHGLQQAYKGVKIAYFPPILMIQLKRFQYNFEQEHNIKILAELQYQEEFDFSPWSITGQKEDYELHAVLVHEGARAESGHYYNFAKEGDLWYKFNDEIVQQVSKEKALKYNYGGFHESLNFDAKEMKVQKKLVQSKTTAYVLVYVKKQFKTELMTDLNKLPEWIIKKNSFKLKEEEIRRNKKYFFNHISIIDCEKSIYGRDCSDLGFLDEFILEKSKKNIDKVPKQANMLEWLYSQNIIENRTDERKKMQQKKPSKAKVGLKNEEQKRKEQSFLIYYASKDRQYVVVFVPKPHHKIEDVLKITPDQNPIIMKTPLQIKRHSYFGIIKRYIVEKEGDKISVDFKYLTGITLDRSLKFAGLLSLLQSMVSKRSPHLMEGQPEKTKRYKFYIEDWKYQLIDVSLGEDWLPQVYPRDNQLYVLVIAQIPTDLTIQEEDNYSFAKWHQNKKDTTSVILAEEKGSLSVQINDVNVNMTLQKLRNLIFDTVLKEKQTDYQTAQNIVLHARLKKGTKNLSEAFEPECTCLKDLIKVQNRVEFSYSPLTVQSRLSNFIVQFYYRNKNFDYSEPIQIVLSKNEESKNIVKHIKKNKKILELLQADGYPEAQVQLYLLSKDWRVISDIMTDEGTFMTKGDFVTFLKYSKNPILVVEGRTTLYYNGESKVKIKQQDDPFVSIILHHVSHSVEKVGIPRLYKVDRRMELYEFKNKILNFIKDQTFGWEGKIYICNPFKTRTFIYGRGKSKIIELTDLESLEDMKRLQIEEKVNQNGSKIKQSKQTKNSITEQNPTDEKKQNQLIKMQEASQQEQKKAVKIQHEQQVKIESDKLMQNLKIEKEDEKENEKEDEKEDCQGQKRDSEQNVEQNVEQAIQEQEFTRVDGVETIYGAFRRVKFLQVQVYHTYLVKPNIALKLNVDN